MEPEMDIVVQPKPKSTKSNEILPLSVDMMEHSDKETDDTDTDDTILHPSPYLQTVLNYPCLILFLSLMVVLPLSYLGAINFSLGDPSGGQIVKDTIEAEQAQAFQKAAEATRGYGSNSQRKPQQTDSVESITLYYVAGSNSIDDEMAYDANTIRTKNVLSTTNVQKMLNLENKLLSLSNYSDVCLKLDGQTNCAVVRSCLPFLVNATDDTSLRSAIDHMYDHSILSEANNALGVEPNWFFEQAKEHDRYTSYVVRTQILLGSPLKGYNNWQDKKREQINTMKKIYLKPVEKILQETIKQWNQEDQGIHLLYYNSAMFNDETVTTILGDVMLTFGSLIFIFIVMLLHTGSTFLAICGLFQVLLSFPVALCLYTVVFQIKIFGVLQVAGIFIILGIGADDVFILTDALKQLKNQHTMTRSERFTRAFSRSFTTMLTTSMTTSFAFGMTAVIKIPTVRYMGVFAMTMVLCNFVMVCTVYLSCLILWDKYIRHSCCTCRAVEYSKEKPDINSTPPLSLSRCLDPCYQNVVAPNLVTHPKKIISFFIVLSLVFLGFATQFREPDSQEPVNPYWPSEHKVSRQSNINVFALRNSSSDAGVEVRVVFGIDTINRTGTDITDDNDLGETVYVKDFDMTHSESQLYMIQVCDLIEKNADALDIAYAEGVLNFNCFMSKFKQWRKDRRQIFPVPSNQFINTYREFLSRNASKTVRDQVGLVVTEDEIEIKFVNLRIITTMPIISLRVPVQELETRWRNFLKNDLPTPPSSIGNKVFPVSRTFLFAQVYEQAVSVAWTTVALSMFITLLVLIAFTQNWQISLLATVAIGSIVIAVIGFVKMLGWVLNPYIATCVTILVGFSVDYTVHMAVAFAEAGNQFETRKDKVVHSVSTMGVSVTAGALSTAGASAFLLGATITFFNSFGIFILTAVCSAYIFAMYFFPALLALVGPEKDAGKLPPVPKWCRSVQRKDPPTKKAMQITISACLVVVVVILGVVFGMAYAPTATSATVDKDASTNTDDIYMPDISTLKEGWHEMKPGGRTSCSRGSPFSFFFKKGTDTENVILEFMGGGACWNELTCGLRTATFSQNIEGIRSLWIHGKDVVPKDYAKKAGHSSYAFNSGINDPSAPNFKTWSHIYVPYCTGDLHWGDADVEYQPGLLIKHRGAVNAGEAMNWMTKNIQKPKTVFVTGCSAGSYASVFWASKVASAYQTSSPTTKVVQFGDSGAGIVTESFLKEAFMNWNSAKNFPWQIVPANLQGDKSNQFLNNFTLPDFYRYGASHFSQHTYSQFNAAYDNNQAFFWLSMMNSHVRAPSDPALVDKKLWSEQFRLQWNGTTETSSVLNALPNYYSWIGWGDNHCVVPYNRYWDQIIGDTTLSDWISSLISSSTTITSMDCRSGTETDPCEIGLEGDTFIDNDLKD